jgi:hypothetical protein
MGMTTNFHIIFFAAASLVKLMTSRSDDVVAGGPQLLNMLNLGWTFFSIFGCTTLKRRIDFAAKARGGKAVFLKLYRPAAPSHAWVFTPSIGVVLSSSLGVLRTVQSVFSNKDDLVIE